VDDPDFSVLIVCTGNLCRSPMAQAVLRSGLDARLAPAAARRLRVASAGVRAPQDAPLERNTLRALAERGIPLDGFSSRRLQLSMVESAGLVLTASRSQRLVVGQELPEAYGRTYTLREFADLLQEVDPAELPADPVRRAARVVELAREIRGVRDPLPADTIDIDDPIGQRLPAFRRCLDSVLAAVSPVVQVLAPDAAPDAATAPVSG
jgi:protein-tyrosine phosphatase